MMHARRASAGFSLVELLVAMTITLIVSGAIYGLMAAGQSSFRREPELTDRQQNIRFAMNLIQGDVANAGGGQPDFFRSFTPGLNGLGPNGPAGVNADFLEVFGNDGTCPDVPTCGNQAITASNIFTKPTLPGCFTLPGLVSFSDATDYNITWSCAPGSAQSNGCSGSGTNGHITFPPGSSTVYNSPGGLGFYPQTASVLQFVRYEVRLDAQNVPNLWRSPTGGLIPPSGGQCKSTSGTLSDGFQLVARGIEDLQVQYLTGAGWSDVPPTAITTYGNIVRQVRVTLSARALAPNLAGQTTSAVGSAVRGQLTSTISPRAALIALGKASPAPMWR
jgi:prepilin-type N-terminal cleavage/methylation domain-containing protein